MVTNIIHQLIVLKNLIQKNDEFTRRYISFIQMQLNTNKLILTNACAVNNDIKITSTNLVCKNKMKLITNLNQMVLFHANHVPLFLSCVIYKFA